MYKSCRRNSSAWRLERREYMRERLRFEMEMQDLGREAESFVLGSLKSRGREDLDFEFDLNYGMEKGDPPNSSVAQMIASYNDQVSLKVKLTKHEKGMDGFEVTLDGNRMEIATERFGLGKAGRDELTR